MGKPHRFWSGNGRICSTEKTNLSTELVNLRKSKEIPSSLGASAQAHLRSHEKNHGSAAVRQTLAKPTTSHTAKTTQQG